MRVEFMVSALRVSWILLLALSGAACAAEALRVPAFTAYIEPQPNALRVSEKGGVQGWTDNAQKVVWHGLLRKTGTLQLTVAVKLPETESVEYTLTLAGKTLRAKAVAGEARRAEVNFGAVEIPAPGYYSFALEGTAKKGPTYGEPEALSLGGAAAEDAHFNLKPRRNAASVHLGYPVQRSRRHRMVLQRSHSQDRPGLVVLYGLRIQPRLFWHPSQQC
jgi:hypothetical protein